MKAIILAAGEGKRLAPLTNTTPKALVKLDGKPLIEILLHKFEKSGFSEVAVNVYHHADQVTEYLHNFQKNSKLKVFISNEEKLLDTGGGIKKMVENWTTEQAILVHNVDIISTINFQQLFDHHLSSKASASLLIQTRNTNRPLFFDSTFKLCGRGQINNENTLVCKPTGHLQKFAFCGIQIINPLLFLNYPALKFYSIDVYLKNAAKGHFIRGDLNNSIYWRDLGTMDDLHAAENDIKNSVFIV